MIAHAEQGMPHCPVVVLTVNKHTIDQKIIKGGQFPSFFLFLLFLTQPHPLFSPTHTHTQIPTPKTKFKTKTKFKMTQYNLPVPTKASSDVLSQATKSTDSTFVLHYFGLHARSKLIQYLLASADAK